MVGVTNRVAAEHGQLYSIEEVAEWLGVSYQLVQKMVKAGKIPAVKFGFGKRHVIRIKEEDLKVLMTSRRSTQEKGEKETMEV
jgi:excisionase family DNA binding protein